VTTAIAADPHFQNADYLIIVAPATLTGTINVRGSFDDGTSYQNLQEPDGAGGQADIAVGADDAVIVPNMGFTHIDVESSGAEGAARTFQVRAVETINQRGR
jgi:hypothetical protein